MAEPAVAGELRHTDVERGATVEAGAHTLAGVGAGVELSAGDAYGLSGEAKSQSRIVLGRFFHQRLAMIGLATFALLGHRLHRRRPLLAVQLHLHHEQPQRPAVVEQTPSAPTPSGTTCSPRSWPASRRTSRSPSRWPPWPRSSGSRSGAIAGFYRGWVDSLLMRFVDLVLVLPVLAVLILLSSKLSKESNNWLGLAVIIGMLVVDVRRPARAGGLPLAARARLRRGLAGRSAPTNRRIIVKHMLPNAVGPIIVNATLTVALSIVFESTLSFLGLGVQPPDCLARAAGRPGRRTRPPRSGGSSSFPSPSSIVLILSIFLIGDGLREAFDPKKSRVRA